MKNMVIALLILNISGCSSFYYLRSASSLEIFIEKLVKQLTFNKDSIPLKSDIIVMTPVMEASYDQTNELGQILQQGLTSALHKQGFNVIDINIGNALKITEKGNFILTRDWQKISPDINAKFVLVSSMGLNSKGLVFNGRLIKLYNNRIISVCSGYVEQAELSEYLDLPEKSGSKSGFLYRHIMGSYQSVSLKGEI